MTIADINILARFLTNTDTSSYTAAQLLIAVNKAYERITGRIIAETAGGTWPYGDKNYTAFPTFTTTLVNSQAEYDIDALFLTGTYPATYEPLMILGVEVLDNTSIWHPLTPISLQQIRETGIAQVEYLKTDGRPIEYEKRENLLVLYPAPDNGVSVTLSGGLKIFYLRTADAFTSAQVTTGTKVPGFPSPWHEILAYEAAYMYAVTRQLPNANQLKADVMQKEKELLSFISRRNQDDRPIITMKHEPHF